MSTPARSRRWLLAAGGVLALAGVCLAIVFWPRGPAVVPEPHDAPPPDPRLSYAGLYQNVHPSVGFVGDQACVVCHRKESQTYAEHPMGRTLAPFTGPLVNQPLDKEHNHPFSGLGLLMRVEKKGNEWMHVLIRHDSDGREVGRIEHPVHYTIGSAAHGSSYLSARDGFILQTPISWYTQKQIWDTSPGFGEPLISGRDVPAGCLYCHSNRFTPEPDALARLKPPLFEGHAIGCERCHGPGEKHVAAPGTGHDPTIVNPARLTWQLRENVCEQCHLQGESRVVRRGRAMFDWRPGLPLEEFLSVFVQADPDNRKANNHVEQMRQSVCFQKSPDEAKLGCISCHDPHVKPSKEQYAAHYRQRCMKCHENKGCSLALPERQKKVPNDSCIDCHMPKYGLADIVHTSATDHLIPRRSRLTEMTGRKSSAYPLRDFHADRFVAGDPERDRDLGIGISRRLRPGHPLIDSEGMRAATALLTHLKRVPTDYEAREALGDVSRILLQGSEAERQYEIVLKARPNRETTLMAAAQAAELTGKRTKAIDYWQRLIEVAPHRPLYRDAYARALTQAGRFAEAEAQARESLRLDPTSVAVRAAVFQLLLFQGKRDEAGEMLGVLRKLRPPNLRELEQQYATR